MRWSGAVAMGAFALLGLPVTGQEGEPAHYPDPEGDARWMGTLAGVPPPYTEAIDLIGVSVESTGGVLNVRFQVVDLGQVVGAPKPAFRLLFLAGGSTADANGAEDWSIQAAYDPTASPSWSFTGQRVVPVNVTGLVNIERDLVSLSVRQLDVRILPGDSWQAGGLALLEEVWVRPNSVGYLAALDGAGTTGLYRFPGGPPNPEPAESGDGLTFPDVPAPGWVVAGILVVLVATYTLARRS